MRIVAAIRFCSVAATLALCRPGRPPRTVGRRQSRDVSRPGPRATPARGRPQGGAGHGLFLDDRRPGAAPAGRRLPGEISVHEAAISAGRSAAAVAEGDGGIARRPDGGRRAGKHRPRGAGARRQHQSAVLVAGDRSLRQGAHAIRRISGRRRGSAISAPATTPIWSSPPTCPRASTISSIRNGRARSRGPAP